MPFVVLLFAMVGFCVADQHTPLAETVAPPSLVTLPPLCAEDEFTEDAAVVVTVGVVAPVVNESWLP